jgi:hypothetical protein
MSVKSCGILFSPRSSRHARYLLACAASAALMAVPLATWGLMQLSNASPDATYRVRSILLAAFNTGITTIELPAVVLAIISGVQPAAFFLCVVLIWLTCRGRKKNPISPDEKSPALLSGG